MKKLLTILLLFISAHVFGQTSPVSPIQLTTNSAWLEPSTGLHWFFNGSTYLWWKPFPYPVGTTAQYIRGDGSLATYTGGGVTSFNSRTGAVVPLTGDYASFYYPLSSNPAGYSTFTPSGTVSQYIRGDGTYAAFPAYALKTYVDSLNAAIYANNHTINGQWTFDNTVNVTNHDINVTGGSIIVTQSAASGTGRIDADALNANLLTLNNPSQGYIDLSGATDPNLHWRINPAQRFTLNSALGNWNYTFDNTTGNWNLTGGNLGATVVRTLTTQDLTGSGGIATGFIQNTTTLQSGAAYNVSRAIITASTPASVATSSGTNGTTGFTYTTPGGGSTSNSGTFAIGGNAPDLAITMGKGGSTTGTPTTGVGGNGGNIYLLAGDAGDVAGTTKVPGAAGETILQGGLSSNTDGGSGGNTSIKGGNGENAHNTSGGNVYLVAGQGHGTGQDGTIFLNVSTAPTVRGNTVIGNTLDDRLHRLQVTGSGKFTDTLIAPRVNVSGLTASQTVATDASKNLVSVANTGTGNYVLSASPTLTGTIIATNANFSGQLIAGTGALSTVPSLGASADFVPTLGSRSSAMAAVEAYAADGTNNRRIALVANNTDGVAGLSMQMSAGGAIPFVIKSATTEWLRISTAGLVSVTQLSTSGNIDATLSTTGSTNITATNANSGTAADAGIVASNGTNSIRMSMPGTGFTSVANSPALTVTGSGPLRIVQNGTMRYTFASTGQLGIRVSSPTAALHLPAGVATASNAPLKFTSGPLLTTPEVGAKEFLTDKEYLTITTGAARKEIALFDIAGTSGRVPYETTNGRLTDASGFTFDGTSLTVPIASASTGVTQLALDNSTKIATTEYADRVALDNVITKTANYTIVLGDFAAGKTNTLKIYVDATAGNVTITLPTAASFIGYDVFVTKIDNSVNTVSISPVLTVSTLVTQGDSKNFSSFGTTWYNQ